MTPELTPGQQRLFDYLKKAIQGTGGAPSLRQAARDLGISHAAVSQGLKILEQKGVLKRQGRYSRTIHLIGPTGEKAAVQRWREVPVVGRITAGLPLYAQQEWEGSLVLGQRPVPRPAPVCPAGAGQLHAGGRHSGRRSGPCARRASMPKTARSSWP